MKITGVDKLGKLSQRIRSVPGIGERAAYRAINATAAKVQTMMVKEITSEIALKTGEVRDLFSIKKAAPGRLEGFVNVRKRPVRLARYGARQLTKAAKSAKGDALRGIARGRKQAGVSVKVGKGSGTKKLRGAFLVPLRAGKVAGGNGFGVFIRVGSEIIHLYGPSPAQLYSRLRIEKSPQIAAMLAKAASAQLRYELTGSRKA